MKLSIYILVGLLPLGAMAQDTDTDPENSGGLVSALERATETIEEADATRSETFEAAEEAPEAVVGEPVLVLPDEDPIVPEAASSEGVLIPEPDLPDAPQFSMPEEDVFLDLPGGDADTLPVSRDAETISVDFPDEDVRVIIRNVADLYELNVVIPETLVGSVSVKLRNVTWRQVFAVVLEPLGFTYIEEGNIIKIKNREELAVEPVDTRVFIINFANANEIINSVSPLINTEIGGKIQVDTRSNALVITERPSKMNGIQEILDSLDRPTEQVMIESKFVEITGRDQKSIGVDWASLAGYGINAGPFAREYTNDVGRVSDSLSSTEGLQQSVNQSGMRDSILSTTSEVTDETNWTGNLLRADTAVFSADTFSVVLSALETNADVELISNPTVVTLNNTAASINIGEEYPIPVYQYNQELGSFEVSDFEFKPIGINLAVTPQINSAGFINLKIQPEISSRTGGVNFGGAGSAVIPIITTRKTSSVVTIKSGYTLAIGGLIEKNTELVDSKVPILGDIPVLGRVFSSESEDVNQRNLIVFITAKILSASGATYRDVFSQRTLYEMGIKARDLPGYEAPDSEKELFEQIRQSRDEIERLRSELQLRQQLEALDEATGKEQEKQTQEETTLKRRFQ